MARDLWFRNASGERELVPVAEVSDLPTGVLFAIAQYSLVGQNGNQNNVLATFGSAEREDAGVVGGDLTIAADHVEVSAMATYDFEEGDGNQGGEARVAPIMKLEKNGTIVAVSASAYQRQATGHNDSSNTIFYRDVSPVIGDEYRIRYAQGSTQNDIMLITQGQFSIKAIV